MLNKDSFVDPILVEPHYSTKIYKGYIRYLHGKIGEHRTRVIIERTGLPYDYLMNEQNWVSEIFADRFYDVLDTIEELDPDYAFQAAKTGYTRQALGPIQMLMLQRFSPSYIYKQIYYFSQRYNKVDQVSIKKQGSRNILYSYRSRRRTKHMATILEEWRGYLACMPTLFGVSEARVEVRRVGDRGAEFNVKWEPVGVLLLLSYLDVAAAIGMFVALTTLIGIFSGFTPFQGLGRPDLYYSFFFSFLSLILFSVIIRRKHLQNMTGDTKSNFQRMIQESEDRYQELYESKIKLDRRYQEANLLRSVIERMSSSLDSEQLISTTIREIHSRLNYRHVLYLTYNPNKREFRAHAVEGEGVSWSTLRRLRLAVSVGAPRGGRVISFEDLRSLLISSVHEDVFNEGYRPFVNVLGSTSFLSAPVALKNQIFGMLFIDVGAGKYLDADDLHAVENVANQLAVSLNNSQSHEKEKQLRLTFQKFVPREVINSLLGETKGGFQHGVSKTITILFCDLRDFTKHSSEVRPEEMVEAVKKFFTDMTEVVYRHGGIVDKYLGDGFMAVFNAFDEHSDHCERAIAAACEMQSLVPGINAFLKERVFSAGEYFELRSGIGIHTGKAILFTIETGRKSEFTAIGESVNVASRLIGVGKLYGQATIVVSSEMVEKIGDRFLVKEIGSHRIRGIQGEMSLFLIEKDRFAGNATDEDRKIA